MRLTSIFRSLLAALVFCSGAAFAHDHSTPAAGQFYISPGAVLQEGPSAARIGHDGADTGVGLILGYGLSDRWAVEFFGGRVESDFRNRYGSGEDDVDMRAINFLYKLESEGDWQPFVVVGAGQNKYGFDGVRPDANDNSFTAGLGVFRSLSDNVALRADLRAASTNKAGKISPFAFLGITGFIGDGPNRVPPADSDGDGVPNSKDKCPTTPPGLVVDEDGCAVDRDQDGVLNAADKCPDTPLGRKVDAEGCEFDTDGDGVVDGDDDCPDTPAGVSVNDRGCPLDADGDGVPDYLDKCPGSEAGAKVDEEGCYIELEEEVTIDMSIEFDVDSAEIRPDHSSELNRAIKFLREYPTANAVIEGHTDSSGAASYNQALSERRAKSVYEYLINEAGVRAERLDWAGFGESRPIAPNTTQEGKQRNRRVTAVVSGTHKVRQQ